MNPRRQIPVAVQASLQLTSQSTLNALPLPQAFYNCLNESIARMDNPMNPNSQGRNKRKADEAGLPARNTCEKLSIPSLKIGCEFCCKGQLLDLIELKIKTLKITLPRAFGFPQNELCSFCDLLDFIVARSSDPSRGFVASVRLRLTSVSNNLFLRHGGVAVYRQIKVILGSRTRVAIGIPILRHIDVIGPSIQTNLGCKESFAMLRKPLPSSFDPSILRSWLKDCKDNHKHKHRSEAAKTVRDLASAQYFRLIDVVEGAIRHGEPHTTYPYLGLSYVWGETMLLYINEAASKQQVTKEPRGKLLDRSEIPKTINDAIDLVKNVGERYLWVDALCIDQFDDRDKEANIAAMSAIYNNGICTIIAADGSDSRNGLQRLRASGGGAERPVRVATADGTVQMLPARIAVEDVLTDQRMCHWSSRARSKSFPCQCSMDIVTSMIDTKPYGSTC